jgi:hypothetical protein
MNEFFPQDNRKPQTFAAAHAEAGARGDGTLYAFHFNGDALNSLGREKLDLMTAEHEDGATTAPTMIYLNLRSDEHADARREAAMAYLKEQGVDENSVKFVAGPNPDATSPAAAHLSRIGRVEGEATEAASGSGKSTPGYKPEPMTR